MIAEVSPAPIAIAIAMDSQGKPNPITLDWVTQTSINPPMLAISVGGTRYSLDAIRQAREFVLAFPSVAMARDVEFHGRHSGRDLDKLDVCGTKTQPPRVVKGALLADAVANFECQLESELPTGDHVIFVGRVVAAHVHQNPRVRRLFRLDNEQLGGVRPAR